MALVQEPTLTQRIGLAALRPARSAWGGFILRRVLSLALSFAVLIVLTFLIVQLLPGDPALVVAGSEASPEQVERVREQLGLNQPVLVQFWDYLRGVLTGDLGTSFASNEAVGTIILNRLPYTASIAGLAMALVLVVALPLGMIVGVFTRGGRARWLDTVFGIATGFFSSVPQYVLGTLLVTVFAVLLGLFPAAGVNGPGSYVLPTIALAVAPTCTIARVVRRETAVVLEQDYFRTARGWRLSHARLYLRYALPNILTVTLTLSGLLLAGMLGGAIIMETVFAWPGLGRGIVAAILSRDYPVIQGIILVLGMLATALIILVDVLLALIDPRARKS